MRLVILCSSLDPGKDGVGDYSRRLAGRLMVLGHQVSLIAFRDKAVAEIIVEDQLTGDVAIPALRIPINLPKDEQVQKAASFIASYNPDIISLQFVPYGFHHKGLPFGIHRSLGKIGKTIPWHFMFHELWIGVDGRINTKDYVIQQLQKFIIFRLIKKLKPVLITTSIEIYRQQLQQYNAKVLPLFSNISVTAPGGLTGTNRKGIVFTVVHFGSFTRYLTEFRTQLTWLKSLAETRGLPVFFKAMGGGGPFKKQSLQAALEIFGVNSVEDAGWLKDVEISQAFGNADFGLSRADHLLCGKSGSTLAMVEHNLPVLLRGGRPELASDLLKDYPELIFFATDKLPVSRLQVQNKTDRAEQIANQFIGYIKTAVSDIKA